MSNLIQIKCKECGVEFPIASKEYNRQLRKGRAPDYFFCSLSCGKTHTNRGNTNYKNIAGWTEFKRQKDEFAHVRYYLRKAKGRNKETNLDLEYLSDLWKSQNGRCAFTGVELVPHFYDHGSNNIKLGSLDRIDSSKGYMKGNVQFISAALNLAKQDMNEAEFRKGLRELFESYATQQASFY